MTHDMHDAMRGVAREEAGACEAATARREVVLYRAHFCTPAIRREIRRLRAEIETRCDVFVVGYCADPAGLRDVTEARALAYSRADLVTLPYAHKLAQVDWTTPTGHNDLPVLRFFRDHPDYDRYWVIEYDVRYTGDWHSLFAELDVSPADLLATTVQRHVENPEWYHWDRISRAGAPVAAPQLVKAFLPFCRVSRAALAAIDRAYAAGLAGHYEGAWPTALAEAGLVIEDIGGTGSFVPHARKRRFYRNTPMAPELSPGTFVFRPTRRDDEVPATSRAVLWHPVKS
jgi:hypothetical protein